MTLEYIIVLIAIVFLIIGIFFGIKTVKFFSKEIVYKLENSFEEQLKNQKDFFEKSINKQMSEIKSKVQYQRDIAENFKEIDDYLSHISQKLARLSANLDTRQELELEIVKFKNIIKKLEKRDHKKSD